MKWYQIVPLWITAIGTMALLIQMIRLLIACKGAGVC